MNSQGTVIFVDDEPQVRRAREQTLELAGYEVICLEKAEDAFDYVSEDWHGIIVTDLKLPGMDGMSLLHRAMEIDPDLCVVLLTGHGDVPMAVEAMQAGAYDFIEKPCPSEIFLDIVKRAMEKRTLILENRKLRSEIKYRKNLDDKIIGRSPSIVRLRKIILNVADSEADVLITGETGTGKELIARCLHSQSRRGEHGFVAVNCGAIPETLIESELFGHEAGAFTGANQCRIGKFEFANRGIIFLDEIESMPLQLQVKLVRVIQERTIERLGSNKIIPINIRVIAATKIDLEEASARGLFREDLFYRLNVVKIPLPPLRERLEDIPLLFQHFVIQACARHHCSPPVLSRIFLRELMTKKWPGNIRELKNESERFVLGLSNMGLQDSFANIETEAAEEFQTLPRQINAFEKVLIEQELIRQNGDIKKTHTALGLPRQTLYDKMSKYEIKRRDYMESRSK